MPPAPKRNASVILYDVKTSPEFAESAKKCLLNICAAKWFLESKDCTKLILLNTQETNNLIDVKHGKCPHVSEATEVIGYDPKLIKPHIEDVETAEADWLMGLAVALEEIKENFYDSKGVMTTQLLFITDFSTPVKSKEKRITYIIENLNKMNVHLYILGPEVKVPHCLSSFEDIQRWAKSVEFVANKEENPNLNIAKQIVQNTKGVICGLELGQELFKCYTNRWSLQPWKVPLTVGSTLTFSTSTTRFMRPVAGPKFKAAGYKKEPWKWHLVDDLLEEIPYNNVIGGVFKHNKFVALPEDVEKTFKCNGPRCFKIIGFTDKTNIPEFYMTGNGSCYVDADGSKNFKLLVRVLAEQKKCVIAQRVYMANCKPKLVALLPDSEEVLLLVELPYGDSIRAELTEQDVSEAQELDRSNPVVDATYDYLQKLDVTDSKNRDEDGSAKVPLSASLTGPLRLNLVTQRCLQKYLGNGADMDEINVKLPNFSNDADYKQFFPARLEVSPKKRSSD